MTKHPLEEKWNTSAWDILSAIERGFRAQADVKGKLAELFLFRRFEALEAGGLINSLIWQDKDGHPDFILDFNGHALKIECKNLRTPQETGKRNPRVELQKTRNNKDPEEPTRGYKIDEFDVLGACLFNHTHEWKYLFIATKRLARRPEPMQRFFQIMQAVPLQPECFWRYDPIDAFKDASE